MENAPVYVKIKDYKEVLDVLDLAKHKIQEIKATLSQINELKNREDFELRKWAENISQIDAKLKSLDADLFRAR